MKGKYLNREEMDRKGDNMEGRKENLIMTFNVHSFLLFMV